MIDSNESLPVHARAAADVARDLDSPDPGLRPAAAAARLQQDGPNTLPEHTRSIASLIVAQFHDVLVYVLIAALVLAAVTPFFHDEPLTPSSFLDAAVIAGILVLNAALGVIQEFRAEKAIAAAREGPPLCAPRAAAPRSTEYRRRRRRRRRPR